MQIRSGNQLFRQRVSFPMTSSPMSICQGQCQVIEIEVLSIWKSFNYQSCIDVEEEILFRVESHVFAGEEFESK